MQRDKKERQQAEKIATTDERLLAAQDELELSREQIEFWRELVDSLNLELRDKEQRIQQVEQELMYTNQELCNAFMLQKLEPDEAIEFAQKILQNQKSVSESLAELLTAIYNRAIKPKELAQMDSSPTESLINAEVNQIVADLEEFKASWRAFTDKKWVKHLGKYEHTKLFFSIEKGIIDIDVKLYYAQKNLGNQKITNSSRIYF